MDEKTVRISQGEYKRLLGEAHTLRSLEADIVAHIDRYGINSDILKTLEYVDPQLDEMVKDRKEELRDE